MPLPLCIPWRSVWLPRVVAAVALVVGLPLFLRSPPWCDVTLYQLAARNILHGGIHYRDLFDTNLPGFVWVMTALYWTFGPSVVAVRVVDLLVVASVVALIDRLAKWGGASSASRWWAIAGAALFYPFTAEMSHAQRDTWMALPSLAAVALRVRRGMGREGQPTPQPPPCREGEPDNSPSLQGGGWGVGSSSPFRRSFGEGLLWGAAVWMKPHIALMALTVWLLTARRLAGEYPRPGRAAAADLLGNLLGGATVGLIGVLWLVVSGTWEPFLDVFLNWNPHYLKLTQLGFDARADQELYWFPPWSMGLIVAVPLALLSVLDMAPWASRAGAGAYPMGTGWLGRWLPWRLWDKTGGTDARFARGLLGGLYLAWAAQAFFVQREFLYVHVPETLLMFGLWAAHRWAWVPVMLLWLVLTSGLWLAAGCDPDVRNRLDRLSVETRERYVPRHLVTDGARLRLWPECWRLGMSDAERYSLWDRLRLYPPHEASIGWEEIAEVADFLRARGVRDGEVIAWHDSPHAVYLLLNIEPGLRYAHVFTAITINDDDHSGQIGREQVMRELRAATGAKYVISDLEWVVLAVGDGRRAEYLGPPRNPPCDLLPANLPYTCMFPFNQPTVFRSRNGNGRYVVHRIVTREDSK